MAHKNLALSIAIMFGMIVAASMALAQDGPPSRDGKDVAHAYIAGMESGDLDALTELFLDDDRSSILENASDEGSWEHYRNHHLRPEMESTGDFDVEIVSESAEQFGDVTLVRQTGSFSVEVDGETRKFRVAVSYFILTEDNQQRIAHLHWSSRPTS